jgi:ribosomal protein S18 acetylase RimI-like enzyme
VEFPDVVQATVADRERVVDTVVSAFRADPAFRYFFPDAASYDERAATYARYLFDRRVTRGTVWVVEGGAAVTMWDPPGDGSEASTVELPAESVVRLDRFHAAVEAALPTNPFWYLGVVATHPGYAGRRWGRSLMSVGLARAAEAGLPAYLETASPRNVDIYRSVGWEVASTLEPDGLPVWVMRHAG